MEVEWWRLHQNFRRRARKRRRSRRDGWRGSGRFSLTNQSKPKQGAAWGTSLRKVYTSDTVEEFWCELTVDQKTVYLIESLAKKQDQQTPIACSLCDQIFFDNRSLVNHFQSHFHQDGTPNARPLVGSSVSRENVTEFFSRSSRSLSVPVNVRATANENLGTRAWQNISSNRPKLLQANHLVAALSQNSLQFRGPTLTHRPQSYPSPSICHSAISNDAFSSQPNQSSNLHSRFPSQLTGPQNSRFPLRPISPIFPSQTIQPSNLHFPLNPGISASQTIQLSNLQLPMNPGRSASQATQVANFHFLVNPVTSTSQPIQQSSLCLPIPGTSGLASQSTSGTSALAAQSTPVTSGLALSTRRNLPQKARENEVEGSSTGYTKPYIMQLEQPIAGLVDGHNDVGGDSDSDAVDLMLKL